MTDEDDRMDRAKRIRQMREGNRDDDAGDEPSDASGEEADDKQTMEDLVTDAAESASEDDPAENGEEVDNDRDEVAEAVDGAGEADEETAEPAETEPTTEESPVDDGSDTETGAQDGDQQSEADAGETEESGGVTAPLPDADTLEAALDGADDDAETGGDEPTPAAGSAEVSDAKETTADEEETRVLEFTLDDEHYCLDIAYIEEIVKEETITRVPNTPEFVAGVVDLRGQITTILNPKVTLGKENTDADELIVVFDAEAFEDQGHIGWVVDDVRQVSPIAESEVNDPPMEADYINGVIDRDDDEDFVIWTSPDLALEEAE